MKVLLLQDVYKLGRAGDVKRVASGYGRNFLIPQGLAVLATPEALKRAKHIREKADVQRELVNKEMDAVAKRLAGVVLTFPARASETGKLYGSVTTQMIAEAVRGKTGVEVSRRQVDAQPLRMLGEHTIPIRLTVDLIPEITAIVYREGEAIPLPEAGASVEELPAEIEVADQPESTEFGDQSEEVLPEAAEEPVSEEETA